MLYLPILVPLIAAAAAYFTRSNVLRPWIALAGAAAHSAIICYLIAFPTGGVEHSALGGWLRLDAPGKIVLGFLSVLFLVCSTYAPGYLAMRPERDNRVFCADFLVLSATTTWMVLSYHLGLMWVAMEATTLASAPLIYFNRNQRSIEAVWKYLLIGSVGIALALLGSLFLSYAAIKGGVETSLLFDDLTRVASKLSAPWLRAAFVLLLIGYGTKMGLAPMHTWKPDAYGEAPGLVGTLLAGGVTSCAFLAILRVQRVCRAGVEAGFVRDILIFMGLFSMAVAAIFMVRQRDFKRMLAYSSVEHMGILAIGVGVGGPALYGALLHMINNGLTKGVLFLSAGNIHRAYGSKSTEHVSGALKRTPLSAALFLIGFLAITGSPPFGPFVSELTIVVAAFRRGEFVAGGLLLVLLAVVFIGMGGTVLAVVQGEPSDDRPANGFRDHFATGAPIVVFAALVLLLGLYIPPPLESLLREAASALEVKR